MAHPSDDSILLLPLPTVEESLPLRIDPRRDRKLNRLVKAAELKSLRRRQALYRAGDPAEEVYLVRSGFVRLMEPSHGAASGRTVAMAGPWELVGEEGLLGGKRRYDCVGGEASTYQVLGGASVYHVLKTAKRTFGALLQGWTHELAMARHLATGSPGPSVRERLAYVLLDLAERWGAPQGKALLLPHHVTHQVLADLAGAHRSTVTTTLNDWIYDGLVAEAERGILLAKPETLRALAQTNGRAHPRG